MHTKKTNNTNKLMQISYHFAQTKIQKLQNLKNNNNKKFKKKKKNFFCTSWYTQYRPILPKIDWCGWYFFRYETGRLTVPVCLPVRYIPTVPTGTVRYWLPWLKLDFPSLQHYFYTRFITSSQHSFNNISRRLTTTKKR